MLIFDAYPRRNIRISSGGSDRNYRHPAGRAPPPPPPASVVVVVLRSIFQLKRPVDRRRPRERRSSILSSRDQSSVRIPPPPMREGVREREKHSINRDRRGATVKIKILMGTIIRARGQVCARAGIRKRISNYRETGSGNDILSDFPPRLRRKGAHFCTAIGS